MSTNPYVPPSTASDIDVSSGPTNDALAGRFTRFAAAMVDGIIAMVITIPVIFATGYAARVQRQEVGFLEQMGMSLLGAAAFLVLNGYLLATRGQSIGKFLTKIQIVDANNGGLLPFLRVYVYRYLWLFPLVPITALIPGTLDENLLNLIALVDALFIFGTAQRCLHDYIAGSKVVLYKENRQRVT